MEGYPPKYPSQLNKNATHLTAPTKASRAAQHDFDAQREHIEYLLKQDPKYPGHSEYFYANLIISCYRPGTKICRTKDCNLLYKDQIIIKIGNL